MTLGPLMLDLRGPELLPEERDLLAHPQVGGVILFSRNYVDPLQITALIRQLHVLRDPPLLVAVDHEGGSVQRFRRGFTRLPACAVFGQIHDRNPLEALHAAKEIGWLLAAELRAVGVDLSFAPVLDLGLGVSRVIRDRAFHRAPGVVGRLASAFVLGMREAGMQAVGKHFPGHGSVVPDSHLDMPVDDRPFELIEQNDLVPFVHLVREGLAGLMSAHVIFPQFDSQAAGFSERWLRDVARDRLKFDGVLFTDDLSMAGASIAGTMTERVEKSLSAGCDLALVCNSPDDAARVVDALRASPAPDVQIRLARMVGEFPIDPVDLLKDERWKAARDLAHDLVESFECSAAIPSMD